MVIVEGIGIFLVISLIFVSGYAWGAVMQRNKEMDEKIEREMRARRSNQENPRSE